MPTRISPRLDVTYVPVLDVARGTAAGYQAQVQPELPTDADFYSLSVFETDFDGTLTATMVGKALDMAATLPTNTFMAIPIGVTAATTPAVRAALALHGSLGGVILDITGFSGLAPVGELEDVLGQYRAAGAKIAVGGNGSSQPELTSIVRLKPAILRLGREWVRDIDTSEAKRSAVEVIGHLAGQLDAWILAEGVSTAAELRALAGLEVPLAQGPLIGSAQSNWPAIDRGAKTALPRATSRTDGVLRSLLQQAYTATNAEAAAAVLPETSGFDLVVVLDEYQRPTALLESDADNSWVTSQVLTVNIATPIADAVSRAMIRPRSTRFSPLACTDDAGRFLGILRMERLMARLAEHDSAPRGRSPRSAG